MRAQESKKLELAGGMLFAFGILLVVSFAPIGCVGGENDDTAEYGKVFVHVAGTVVVRGSKIPISEKFSIGYKPGKLTGSDQWETVEKMESVSLFGYVVRTGSKLYPGEPWNWQDVPSTGYGEFSMDLLDGCDSLTLFVRVGGQVFSKYVSGPEFRKELSNMQIEVPLNEG